MGIRKENGPSKWAQLSDAYGICEKGKRQSPIAIETASTIPNNKTSIKFDRLDVLMKGTLKNTGHGVEYEPTFGAPTCPSLIEVNVDFPGLEMCHPFRLAQFHFLSSLLGISQEQLTQLRSQRVTTDSSQTEPA